MKTENTFARMIMASFAAVLFASVSVAAGEWNVNKDNIVLDGYDVVAYQNADKPIKGSKDFSLKYDGVTFYFANKDNMEAFKSNPEKYAPAFNGFCAFGVAMHKAKVPTNPATFKMYNGKLLLFFNDMYEGKKVNTKLMWNGDEAKLYTTAVKNWKELAKK